ncbi:host attachment family protein [Alteraurantiacibacter aestuarii]|uniref:host attachment family protein n=1 Tax=Alteraurantiacibacter aestuarii TaxID=650004 RepID=UPI0031D39C0F
MKLANGTLVLVADGQKLMAFKNDGDAKFPVLTTLTHREIDNPPSSEQGSDRSGRSFSSTGEQRSAYKETDWHQQEEDRFAGGAAQVLKQIAAQEDGKIVVVAAPHTLGELRKHYGKAIQERLVAEIDKDLTNQTTDDIVAVIAAHDAA